jgi:hypothetical protein
MNNGTAAWLPVPRPWCDPLDGPGRSRAGGVRGGPCMIDWLGNLSRRALYMLKWDSVLFTVAGRLLVTYCLS